MKNRKIWIKTPKYGQKIENMDVKYGHKAKIWTKYGNMDINSKIWKNMENMDIKVYRFELKPS